MMNVILVLGNLYVIGAVVIFALMVLGISKYREENVVSERESIFILYAGALLWPITLSIALIERRKKSIK